MELPGEEPESDGAELTAPAPIMPPENAPSPNAGYHYINSGKAQKVGGGEPGTLLGGSIEISIGSVETPSGHYEIGPGGSHSLGQLAFANDGTVADTVELGWDIDPHIETFEARSGEPLDHLRPHLFTFVNRDGYSSKEDCYDCHFVPSVGAKFVPGQRLVSTGPNTTYKFAVVYREFQWWVWFGNEWIGYLEGNFWSGGGTTEFRQSKYHLYYGEVFDNRGDNTDMGNGDFGGNEAATLMRNPVGFPTAQTSQTEELGTGNHVSPESDAGVAYGIGNISADRRSWRFGGPGRGVVKNPPEYATGIGPNRVAAKGAELDGEINPNGFQTSFHFEYGKTSSYGNSTATASAGSGWNPVAVSAQLTGLTKSTTYHYRLVATNAEGTVYSGDETFSTGAEWTATTLPNPSGGKNSYLNGISCQTITACKAVGTFSGSAGRPPLAESLSGTTWAAQEPTRPGVPESVLLDISCPSSSWCMAVGVNRGSTGERPLAEVWNGSSWTVQAPPTPSGVEGQLTGVSCRSAEWCMATGGTYLGAEVMYLAHWNGKEWTAQNAPAPVGGSKDRFSTSISCSSTSFCVAVGTFTAGVQGAPLAVRWNGTTWTAEEAPSGIAAEGEGELTSVSCFSASFCEATLAKGRAYPQTPEWFGVEWNGSGWTKKSFPEPVTGEVRLAEVNGLSCYAAGLCLAIGNSSIGEGYSLQEKPLAATLQQGRWSLQEPPIPSGVQGGWERISLMEVSCVADPACVAVGTSHPESGEAVPLAEVYK
jgi:hypothetical protein